MTEIPVSRRVPTHCDQPMTGVELREVYDGTCYWWCEVCGKWQHRFKPNDPRRARTALLGKLDANDEILPEPEV